VVKGFEEFMTSTEDLVGWLFALQEWQPGNAEFSLLILLNKIRVGQVGHYEEEQAVSLLSNLDGEGFRELCHIPEDEELIDSGMSREQVNRIRLSMPYKLEGWLKIAKTRAEQNRGWVHMFNKSKHHMLAFPTQERDKDEVWLPTSIKFDKAKNHIRMGSGWLEVSTNMLRRFAGDAIAAQATLNDTLALILVTRYGEKYEAPQWVTRALHTEYLWHC